MKTIPSKIKIGYQTYKLEGVDRGMAEQLGICGQIDYNKEHILFNQELKPLELFNTILHECLHGIFQYHGTNFKNSKHEEDIVNTVANGLTTLLVDNPKFIAYLKHALKETEND